MNCFELWTSDIAASVGEVSDSTGTRPSALFEWNDPDDWAERLAFDIFIISTMHKRRDNNASG